VRRLLAALEGAPFSYPVPGATRGAAPSGYTVDHNRVRLGTGADAFRRAIEAVRRWAMFHLGWLELVPPAPELRVGMTVGVLVQHPGFWSLNPCRIVYLVDEEARFPEDGSVVAQQLNEYLRGPQDFAIIAYRP